MANDPAPLSIGALSRATGVPSETIRTWERRYGFPDAERTPSGHRRYSLQTAERLRLVTQVLQLGYRPSTALAADVETLREILRGAKGEPHEATTPAPEESPLERWFEHVERFESRALERELRSAWGELDASQFLQDRVAPFLFGLGERWARGELGVRHEHFASERLREFLSAQWRPLSDAATGPTYLLATLPGEQHVLGLHLAATVVALAGGRVVFLGADTPAEEIARAAEHHSAQAVLLSAAQGADRERNERSLEQLRRQLPAQVSLALGGGGFSGYADQDTHFESLAELDEWLQRQAAAL